ncbi:RHS repeat-associated core domain-containing protein [Pseudomonas sp. NY11955]|uniref:RHS repeat-associated core domain-containing protein n=1 Tax=Pseudomonas sp. NY11955 TaxID=3400363 RepID=UPI003A8528A1
MNLNPSGTRSSIESNSSVSGGPITLHQLAYTPYGFHIPSNHRKRQCKFNGEMQDDLTGNYFLGIGHRVYSPTQMRFISYDQLSPFGRGGINGYVYCSNDPINFTDPTGRVKFQTTTPGPHTRTIDWLRIQRSNIYSTWESFTSRMRGRRTHLSPFEATSSSDNAGNLPEYSSTNPPPEYTATPLQDQYTITFPYQTKLRPTPEQAEQVRGLQGTLEAKREVIKLRINNPDLKAEQEHNKKLLFENDTRIIVAHSLVGHTFPPTYFEAQRLRQL